MRKFPIFVAVVVAAPFIVVFGFVLLTVLQVTAPIVDAVSVSGPSGVGKGVIEFNAAWIVFAVLGVLAVPSSIALYLLIGGRGEAERLGRGGRF
jgi:hypothetical protein